MYIVHSGKATKMIGLYLTIGLHEIAMEVSNQFPQLVVESFIHFFIFRESLKFYTIGLRQDCSFSHHTNRD